MTAPARIMVARAGSREGMAAVSSTVIPANSGRRSASCAAVMVE